MMPHISLKCNCSSYKSFQFTESVSSIDGKFGFLSGIAEGITTGSMMSEQEAGNVIRTAEQKIMVIKRCFNFIFNLTIT